MIQKVQKQIEDFQMITANDRVIAAVSGGADSVCLLFVLKELSKKMDFFLETIHIEHGIRGIESKKDAKFVEHLCSKLDIPYHMIEVDVPTYSKEHGIGMEESARILRYQAFADYIKQLKQYEQNKIIQANELSEIKIKTESKEQDKRELQANEITPNELSETKIKTELTEPYKNITIKLVQIFDKN